MSNDRFKFRVWRSTVNNYDPDRFKLTQDGRLNIGGLVVVDPENYTIEQCTGLTDKNGKLIYEGDVIQENGINRYIHWHNGGWCYSVRYDSKCHWHLSKEDVENAEIIGNIHDDQFRDLAKMVEGEQC